MVAHDAKTGKATRPTVMETDKDGVHTFPNDPQINSGNRDVARKPLATLQGYARGGTTNPPAGVSGDVEYFDPAGKPTSAADALGPGDTAVATEAQALRARRTEVLEDTKVEVVDQPVDDPAESSGSPKRSKVSLTEDKK